MTDPNKLQKNQPVCVFNYTGTKVRQCLIWNVFLFFVHEWVVLCMFCAHYPCIIYQHMIVICTHLHKALSVCTYAVILSHMIFLIHVHVSKFCLKTMKKRHVLSDCVSICVSVSYMIWIIFFFSDWEINLQADNYKVYCKV